MKLALLRELSAWLGEMSLLLGIKRVGENLLFLNLKDSAGVRHRLYCDMTRGRSGAFMSEGELGAAREFSAPFDSKLALCCARARIESARVDGENRILQLTLCQSEHYKRTRSCLHLEFTGKHSNAILCDEEGRIIEALRHIPLSKSWREVRVGVRLQPLPQPESRRDSKPITREALLSSLLAAYEAHYTAPRKQLSLSLLASLRAKCENLLSTRDSLPPQSELEALSRQYARYGELLFSTLHTLPPHAIASPTLTLTDEAGKAVELPLPPQARSLSEAGNWYFTQSKKLAKKAKNLHKQRENLDSKIEFLRDKIALVEQRGDLGELLQPRKKNEKKSKESDSETLFIEGLKISIGRNARENQQILNLARADDMWLHIRDVPSAHIIIHCGKQTPSRTLIEKAAAILCGLYAARRGGGDFVVDYTRRRFVKSSGKAQVLYAKYESIGVRI